MTQQVSIFNKRLLILLLFGIIAIMYSYAQRDIKNLRNVADEDMIRLINPNFAGNSYDIPGVLFKAIDTRFIVHQYDFIRSGKTLYNVSLFTDTEPSRDGHERWIYYINNMNNIFMSSKDARSLISTIMPQAIESIDFSLPKNFNKEVVRFYTRDTSRSAINDSTTIYFLEENKIITRKIFDAINPAFIRSLRRITNKEELAEYMSREELAEYKNKDIKEIV